MRRLDHSQADDGLDTALSTPDQLVRIAKDSSRDATERCEAIQGLIRQLKTEHRLTALLLPLLDDAVGSVCKAAIRGIPVFDARGAIELWERLLDPGYRHRGVVVQELARRKDDRLLPYLVGWLRGSDYAQAEWALDGLKWLCRPDSEVELLNPILESRPPDEISLQIAIRIDQLEALLDQD